MEKGIWAIFLFPYIALAADCRELVATAFGFEKPTTVALSDKGRVIQIDDTLSVFGWSPTVRFVVTERGDIGPFHKLRSFSAKPTGDGSQAYLLIVDDAGIPKFAVPGFGVVPLMLPSHNAVTAAAMHTTPIRETQKKATQLESEPFWPNVKSLAEGLPIRLYFAADNGVYFSTVRSVPLGDLDEKARAALEGKRMVKVEPPHPAISDLVSTEKITVLRENIVDFDRSIADTTIWIPQPKQERAVQLTQFVKIADFPSDFPVKELDFITPLTSNHLLLASEVGKIAIWDVKEKKVLSELSFPQPGWLGSITGHELGGDFHVWAINAADKQIYQWRSGGDSNTLSPVERGLPKGVLPVQITSAGEPLATRDFGIDAQAGGLAALFTDAAGEIYSQRVLVLGDDNKVYGRTSVQTGVEIDHFWLTDDDARVQDPPKKSP